MNMCGRGDKDMFTVAEPSGDEDVSDGRDKQSTACTPLLDTDCEHDA